MASSEEEKLERFLEWLQVNGVQLRCCKIKNCDSNKGFGFFASDDKSDGILVVVPLDLAITPMRVLQDPLIGPECSAMFEEGEVDDRFLMMLFLTVEHLRKNSSWKPYFDMLPTSFGNTLWFTDDELLELKGTTLFKATELQKKKLQSLYEDKVKNLVEKLLSLDGNSGSEVCFEDFLWANSVFWARALNIPLPHSYVFPPVLEYQESYHSANSSEDFANNSGALIDREEKKNNKPLNGETSALIHNETIWVEGLVPGIDFCNHDLKASATWEVDGTGSTTGVPSSMYLLSAGQGSLQAEKEIFISYGSKGNEELLYLYGFVIDNNPDDYLMVNYPVEAIQNVPSFDSKGLLLQAQKAEMRCLLPKGLLDHGFFPEGIPSDKENSNCEVDQACNYSWSGHRKTPSYLSKLVFPQDFLAALRTIAMKEDEIFHVSSLLEELVGSGGEREPSDAEVRAAVWEACGDSGALQLLVDLLHVKLMDLEEGSGTEEHDSELLEKSTFLGYTGEPTRETNGLDQCKAMSRNTWSSIIYRRGQKQLTRLFLKEAEHALQLSLGEGN